VIMTKGTIATFYSYKGGVGRSFALANVAAALAKWGYRVLCVDWDLEAPGLTNYLAPTKAPESGLVELITTIKDQELCDWRGFLSNVAVKAGAKLDLIAAGKRDHTYIDRLQSLNWEELYETKNGLSFAIETWNREWRESYDVVLIDSRTGVTDIGAICTAYLPDIVVGLFTANNQSLDGFIEVMERAQKARKEIPDDLPAILTLPVPSRFDSREEYKRAETWRNEFAQRLRHFYRTWLPEDTNPLDILNRTTIPYVAYWSFGEGLPVIEEPYRTSDSLRYHFETLAALIALKLGQTDLLFESPERYIDVAERAGRRTMGFKYDIYVNSTSDLGDLAIKVSAGLEKCDVRVYCRGRDEAVGDGISQHRPIEQSQHAVFLLGREYSSKLDSELRMFGKLALEEELLRVAIPVKLFGELSQNVPGILRGTQISTISDISPVQLAERIISEVSWQESEATESTIKNESDLQLELAREQIKSKDAAARVAAARVFGREKDGQSLRILFDSLSDPDQRVANAAEEAIQQFNEQTRREFGSMSRIRNYLTSLSSDDTNKRIGAAKAIGLIGNPIGSDWLLPRASEEVDISNKDVRQYSPHYFELDRRKE